MLVKEYQVEANDYQNAGKVSSMIKKILKQLVIERNILRRIAIGCYEAEINMIIHSYGGLVKLTIDTNKISLHFQDVGPGIMNLELALTPGYSTASAKAQDFGFGAGMGLCNMKRVADNFVIKSSKQGTEILMEFNL